MFPLISVCVFVSFLDSLLLLPCLMHTEPNTVSFHSARRLETMEGDRKAASTAIDNAESTLLSTLLEQQRALLQAVQGAGVVAEKTVAPVEPEPPAKPKRSPQRTKSPPKSAV